MSQDYPALRPIYPRTIIRIFFSVMTMSSTTTPSIDKRIYELLLRPGNIQFTVRCLRDQYIEKYDVDTLHKAILRRFIYERVKKLVSAGFVEKDSQQRKRDQAYHVKPKMKEAELNFDGEDFEIWLQRISPQVIEEQKPSTKISIPNKGKDRDIETSYISYSALEKKLNEAQSRFLESLGETEAFQQLMKDHPELKPNISCDYRSAREQSSRLLGHVSALEKALRHLKGS